MSDTSLVFTIIGRDRSAGALSSASQRISKLKLGLAAAFGATTAVIGSSINKAAQFDKTIRVAGAAANASAADLKSMSDMALQMGAKTQFGAQGAADAMLELAKGGMTLAEQKAGALAGTMQLAAAGGLELGAASTYMVNTLNTFGLGAEKAAAVAAALAGGANASTASVESLGMALSQVGPGAKNAGLAMEETVAVLAAFDQAGIKGSDAGTSLKTMLARLVPTTDAAKSAMRKLGLEFVKADGSFESISNIAEQLKDKLGGLSESQKTATLQTIFGSDATRAASVLADQGAKGLAKYIKATKDKTAAEKMAKTQTEGAAGNMRKFSAAVDSLQIAFGIHLLPAVTSVTGALADLVAKVSTKVDPAMSKLKDFAKDAAPAFDKMRDAVADAFGKLDLSGVATSLTSSSKGWAQAIISGVQQGFDTGDWSGLGSSLGAGLGSALRTSGELAATLFTWIGEQVKEVNWVDLGVEMGKQAPSLLAGLAIGILNFDLDALLSGLGDHWFEAILGVLTVAFLPAKVIGALTRILGKIPFAGKLLSWGVGAIHKAARGLATAGGRLFVQFASGAIRGIARTFPRLGNKLEQGLTGLVHVLTRGAPKMGAAVGRWGRSMLGALATVPGKLATKAGELIGGFLGGLGRAVGKLDSWLGGFGGRIVGKVGDLSSALYQKGLDFVQGFINGIKEKAKAIPGIIGGLAGGAVGWLGKKIKSQSPSRVTMQYGRWFSEGFAIGIKDKSEDVMNSVKEMIDKLREKIQIVKDFAKQIREAFRASGDLTSLEYGAGSQPFMAQLNQRANKATEFAAGLSRLRSMGLNSTTLSQLRDAGPEGGYDALSQINAGNIGEINRLVKQIDKAGKGLSDSESRAEYGFAPGDKQKAKVKVGKQKVEITLDAKGADQELLKVLRKLIRVQGGNVQAVLGK